MPRNVPWRHTLSDFVCASQAFAGNATIYILRQTGPTGFLLKEEGESKDYKVFLGDPHSCTCPTFRKEKDLCKHICWVLLKKFRMDRDNPLSWQLGLSEMEINQVLRGPVIVRRQQQQQRQSAPKQVADAGGGRPMVAQREISDEDVCPICQDELLEKKLPVTYCKFGCGNNVHIKCMKVWAEHQLKTSQDSIIKCPMCREDFGPITLLKQEMHNAGGSGASSPAASIANRMDRHVGIGCSNCRMAPIEGKCYRCCVCADFYLCQACFNTPAHTHHSFQFRHKRNQRWRNAQRTLGAALPDAIINDMMNRELSESDYDILLQLDNPNSEPLSDLTEEVIQSLPVERVRERGLLLAPGSQCRVCLRGFQEGQFVRKLPCQHKFHKDCIDGWLLHTRPTCPVDGSAVFTTRPHSDGSARRSNRIPNTSAGSAGDSGSVTGGYSGRNEVRALSVPALGVTAMRLGGAGEGDGRREGERGILSRRPTRDPHVPHRPPLRLELTGTRVGSDDGGARTEAVESSVLPPGGRILQQALQRRARLNQQLAELMLESTLTPPTIDIQDDEHDVGDHVCTSNSHSIHTNNRIAGHVMQASPLQVAAGIVAPEGLFDFPDIGDRRGSVGSGSTRAGGRAPQRRHPPSLHSKGLLRQRSNSHDRAGSNRSGPQPAQDLYLGNDPHLNPPPVGDVTALQTNMRGIRQGAVGLHHNRQLQAAAHRLKVRRNNREPDIVLEGNGLENLTLRDLL